MKTTLALGVLVAGAMFAGVAGAHGLAYIQPNVCPGGLLANPPLQGCLITSDGCDLPQSPTPWSVGGVVFCVGHVLPDGNNENVLTIADNVNAPVSGSYCQDLNGDSICGGPDVNNPGTFLEPRTFFCGSITIQTPLIAGSKTPTQWQAGNNWDTASEVLVFISAVGNGNIASGGGAGNPCQTVYSGGVEGSVTHS